MPHVPFPKIPQFRDVLVAARKKGITEIQAQITVKVHGTNAAIRFTPDGVIPQSRNLDLSLMRDNRGFAKFVAGLSDKVLDILHAIADENGVVYGEWAGRGIQSGVAVSEVEPFFMLFGRESDRLFAASRTLPLTVATPTWDEVITAAWEHQVVPLADARITTAFYMSTVDLDLNDAVEVARFTKELAAMCEVVEGECPIGRRYGVFGVGEGIVVDCGPELGFFKVKGQKHSESKVKTLVPLDVEKVSSMREFGDTVLTEPRLRRGMEFLREQGLPLDRTSTGAYLSFVVKDVFEECADLFVASSLNDREARKEIGTRAREFFMKEVAV
jgi:hypothetical protein